MDTFGQKLRVAKGFSQAELTRRINSHHSIVGKYERDEVNPTIDVVKKTRSGTLLCEGTY